MANSKKKHSSKPKPRPKVEPKATDKLIRDMAERYRLAYIGETPDDIYERRKAVHEEMSKYSNELDIYNALRLYEKEYGVESEPLYGMVLTPFKDIFPGYLADTDSEGNVIGYSRIDNYDVVPEGSTPVIGDMDIDTFSKIRNEVHVPDFLNTYVWYQTPSTLPSTNSLEEEYEEDDEDLVEETGSTDILPEDIHLAYFYNPSALDIIPQVTGELKVNVPLPVPRGIRTIEETIEEEPIDTTEFNPEVSIPESLAEPQTEQSSETIDNNYFPTTLNRSVYAPRVDIPSDLEPELSDEEYARLYENRTPSTSTTRKKVRLPEEIFANMTDLNKAMYDMLDMLRRRSYGRLTPEAVALLDYAYEQLHPTYMMPHPLTYDLWMMHPVSYPYIPQLGFFFNPNTRKYVFVRN